ncbi:hypothetical protein B7P43_G15601, partial [Cryptotermes secundus]
GLIVALTVVVASLCVDGYPTYQVWDMKEITEEDMNKSTRCSSDNDTETLCQRCAKSTKSITLYPLCCDKKETVREWCESYLNFGIRL